MILIVSPFSITLLPVNNSLANPEYWYEILFSNTSLGLCLAIAGTVESQAVFHGLFRKGQTGMIADLFMAHRITDILTICFIHIIWTNVFGYYEPFPNRSSISSKLACLSVIIRGWYLIRKQERMNPTTRKRCMTYFFHFVWMIFFDIQLNSVFYLFVHTFRDLQWMIALIAPLMKDINDRIVDKLITNSASQEHHAEAKFIGKIKMNIFYSLWLATSFSMLTPAIQYILLAISFFINISLCYKVIRLNGKTVEVHIR